MSLLRQTDLSKLYGKYIIIRDLSCEILESVMTWPCHLAWQFRFGCVAVLHFWALQLGFLTVITM